MGTDIHMYVEKRNKQTGEWEITSGENPMLRFWKERLTWDGITDEKIKEVKEKIRLIESGEDEWDKPTAEHNWAYDGRNYTLFSVLGNVRNGYGTEEFIPYIQDCRGIPEDATSYIEEAFDSDYMHSVGHIYLDELLAYNWSRKIKKSGLVGESQYEVFFENGSPQSWAGGVGGGSVKIISNEEMERLMLNPDLKEEGKSYYTNIEWEIELYEYVSVFVDKTISLLKNLSKDDDMKDVRIIFGFDS